jgi:hypothetical protein
MVYWDIEPRCTVEFEVRCASPVGVAEASGRLDLANADRTGGRDDVAHARAGLLLGLRTIVGGAGTGRSSWRRFVYAPRCRRGPKDPGRRTNG